MSAELARRLLQTGVVPPEEVHAALLDMVTLGVPFVQALVSRGASVGDLVERELARMRVPSLRSVKVAPELTADLPVGMCERLLAVPVGASGKGEIEIACVDPLDPAVGIEFSDKLQAPVRIVRAPLAEILLAIERWLDDRDAGVPSARTPAFGTRAVRKPSWRPEGRLSIPDDTDIKRTPTGRPSSPPIPLVRRSLAPDPTRLGSGSEVTIANPGDEGDETVIDLFRTKGPSPIEAAIAPSIPPPPPSVEPLSRELDAGMLDVAASPDQVVKSLVDLVIPLARSAVVFAAKAGVFEVRQASADLAGRARGLRLEVTRENVLERAAREGHYLGTIPEGLEHADVRALVGDVEVYATPVMVSDRAALVLLLGDLRVTFDGTRRADELALRAGRALERIVRAKKHST
jgi:hypothetical protein